MRPLLVSFFLLLTLSAHATIEVEPIAPTDRSYVVLQVRESWRDGCVPFHPQVTRAGNRIEVLWQLPDGGCPLVVSPWNADVPLGLLPAGTYELVVKVDDFDGVNTVATRTVVVHESAPAFRVEPRVVSAVVATEVRIEGGPCFGDDAVVTVDGVTVPSRASNCALIATLPPHAAGAANVRVRAGTYDQQGIAAVRYVDPAAAPDRSLYERVLVPVLFEGPGAYGSQWVTEAKLINASQSAVTFLPDVAKPLTTVASRASVSLDVFGNRLAGLLLFVPRGADVRFGSIFRDISRDMAQWGTEMPIVRESETRASVTLANVPFDSRYRLQLRIYGIDGRWMPVEVTASRGSEVIGRGYVVTGPCPEEQTTPCNSNQPAYKSLDLVAELPSLAGKGRYDITVQSAREEDPSRLWAFVTVTNNDTQQVTVISPQ